MEFDALEPIKIVNSIFISKIKIEYVRTLGLLSLLVWRSLNDVKHLFLYGCYVCLQDISNFAMRQKKMRQQKYLDDFAETFAR